MADQKVSDLPSLNGVDVDAADLLYIVDSSAGTAGSKKITVGQYQLAPYSAGTANGVMYLNGSNVVTTGSGLTFDGTNFATTGTASATKLIPTGGAATGNGMYLPAANTLAWSTNGTESMRLDSSGNLGLGVTPGTWASAAKALDFSFPAFGQDSAGSAFMSFNARESSSGNWVYKTSDEASRFVANIDGGFRFFTAPSGTAGNAISFTQAMTLDASGNLGVGSTTANRAGAQKGISVEGSLTSILETNINSSRAGYLYSDAASTIVADFRNFPLVFRTNDTERARITSGGDLLVGAAAPAASERLLVAKTGSDAQIRISNSTTGNAVLTLAAEGVDAGDVWFERSTSRLYVRNSSSGGVYLASNATAWTAVSDERFKTALTPIEDAASKVSSLRAVTGRYKTDAEDVCRSFLIAQDVQAVFPEAVNADNPDELGLSYTDMVPLLVAAIKEQQALITDLRARVAALEAQ